MTFAALFSNSLRRAGMVALAALMLFPLQLRAQTPKPAPKPAPPAAKKPAPPPRATQPPARPQPAQATRPTQTQPPRAGQQQSGQQPPHSGQQPTQARGAGESGGRGGGPDGGGARQQQTQATYNQYPSRPTAKGGMAYTAPNGHVIETNKSGQPTSISHQGFNARLQNGKVSTVHDEAHGLTMQRAPNGIRQVETKGPGGSRVVGTGPNHGYRETAIPGTNGLVQRTYVEGGVHYSRVYRQVEYRGIHYNRYVPPVVYSHRFYAWEARPWRQPVVYQWGWQAQPWYGYYQGYFTPAPRYADAAMLLTDYIIAENLRTAYEARQESCAGCAAPTGEAPEPISDVQKEQLASQVRQELASSDGGGSSSGGEAVPEALDPKIKMFVVSMNVSLDAGDSNCSLTNGDLLTRLDETVTEGKVNVRVDDSQPGNCPKNTVSQVEVATLQEMHNHFRENLDAGQKMTAENEGKNGLPAGPPAGATAIADGQTTDDSAAVRNDLAAQQQLADQSETQAQQEADQHLQPAVYRGGATTQQVSRSVQSPVSLIRRGQTVAQVVSNAGQPQAIKAFGPILVVYVYQGYAVTFKNGMVDNVVDHTTR